MTPTTTPVNIPRLRSIGQTHGEIAMQAGKLLVIHEIANFLDAFELNCEDLGIEGDRLTLIKHVTDAVRNTLINIANGTADDAS